MPTPHAGWSALRAAGPLRESEADTAEPRLVVILSLAGLPLGLVVDGVWCGPLGRTPLVLPLIVRLADLEADWSMRRRVAALDGTMEVSSPAGGPTVIDVMLPCVW
ncbi:hypothetical protein [Streptomyces sp. NBC_00453]|uniref:hypothetical protein n=1 Tax=Streptomyces sp. NBC_00453 TaxID=2903653 RepID=UPI002E227453